MLILFYFLSIFFLKTLTAVSTAAQTLRTYTGRPHLSGPLGCYFQLSYQCSQSFACLWAWVFSDWQGPWSPRCSKIPHVSRSMMRAPTMGGFGQHQVARCAGMTVSWSLPGWAKGSSKLSSGLLFPFQGILTWCEAPVLSIQCWSMEEHPLCQALYWYFPYIWFLLILFLGTLSLPYLMVQRRKEILREVKTPFKTSHLQNSRAESWTLDCLLQNCRIWSLVPKSLHASFSPQWKNNLSTDI